MMQKLLSFLLIPLGFLNQMYFLYLTNQLLSKTFYVEGLALNNDNKLGSGLVDNNNIQTCRMNAITTSESSTTHYAVTSSESTTPYATTTTSESTTPFHTLSRRDLITKTATTSMAATIGYSQGLYIPNENKRVEALENVVESPQTNKIIIPKVQLGQSSLYVSKTIQGYWQLAGGHGRYQESDAIANMQSHYNVGMTTLDTADIYGPSEIIIGKFMKLQPNAIPNTKFCCFRFLDDISRSEVKERILRSCERLQVSKLPLVQYFWSNYDIKKYVDVALYLTELKEQGYIQEIGATNFDLTRLKELKKADVPIVAHQVQLSALDRRPIQSGMADWCKDNQISLIAFGTVGSGLLSNRWLGKPNAPTAEERNTASMRMYSTTASRFGDWKQVQELLRTMDIIAKAVRNDGRCVDANISNIAQRYVLDGTPSIASLLIGVRNQDHISENVRTHSFQLNPDEILTIDKVVAKRRGPVGDVWDLERGVVR